VQTHDAVTIYDLLLGAVKDPHEAIIHTEIENLDIIPANIDLSAAEVHLVNEVAREQILASVLRKVSGEYDVILVDCQPSLGLLTVNALTASHGVLIPLECEFFALRGVALLVETIDKVRDRLNPGLELDAILATMFDSRTLHSREVLQRVVEAFGDRVLETVIGRTVKFPDASVAGKPIIEFAPEHPASKAYSTVARELISRGAVA
jgi:chromosome partitioning protein